MRPAFVCALLLAGCGGSNAPPVSLTFSQVMTTPAVGQGYVAPVGSAAVASGTITMQAKSEVAAFLVQVDVPPSPITIPVGEHFLVVNYTLADGSAWASSVPNGDIAGTITFVTAKSPYKLTFKHIQMIGTGGASGAFFIDGAAQFAE